MTQAAGQIGRDFKAIALATATPLGVFLLLPAEDEAAAIWLRDPAATAGVPHYTGMVANLVVLAWASAGAIAVYAAAALSRLGHPAARARYLAWLGLLTLVLATDDLLQLHEDAWPSLTGYSELAPVALYGAWTLALLARFRSVVWGTPWLLLACALGCFALSVAADTTFAQLPFLWRLSGMVVEDWAKATGVAFWLAYVIRCSLDWLAPSASPRAKAS